MLRYATALIVLLALLLVPTPAYAHHGNVTGPECGVYEWDGVADMTKGRTDGMVYRVDYSVGCKRVILSNLSPAGIGEAQGNAGQMARCERYGREDAVNTFNYYFHEMVSPSDVKVTCSRWTGGD